MTATLAQMTPLAAIALELTPTGYLVVPALVARALFPHDVALWLYPTRGPAGGGLLLKQRNPAGDRCVLLTETLGARAVRPGPCAAMWDARAGALRVPLDDVAR